LVYEVLAPSEAEGRSGARQLLALKARPTALLCATDMIAIGAMAAARDLGLVPGRDIAIVGHDGLSVGAFSDPPLSTMEIAAANVGELMADLMLKRIGGANPRDLQMVLPIRQVPRGTHGPPRASRG
jgi:LacI family transcriptional regulator